MAWQDRNHFFEVAAGLMRRILVDYARAHRAGKRGIALEDALNRLSEWDPRQSRIVELRSFVGLTEDEIAEVIGVSLRTVKRDWAAARAWLHGELVEAASASCHSRSVLAG